MLTNIWWPLHINKHRSHWHHLFTRWQEASVWMVSRAIYKYLGCLLINRWVVLSRVVLKTTHKSGRLRKSVCWGFYLQFCRIWWQFVCSVVKCFELQCVDKEWWMMWRSPTSVLSTRILNLIASTCALVSSSLSFVRKFIGRLYVAVYYGN